MNELGKVKRVIEKQSEIDEVLLVLDATTDQNGLQQAKVFAEAVDVTGIVLTKLDGTAKGGIVVAVASSACRSSSWASVRGLMTWRRSTRRPSSTPSWSEPGCAIVQGPVHIVGGPLVRKRSNNSPVPLLTRT